MAVPLALGMVKAMTLPLALVMAMPLAMALAMPLPKGFAPRNNHAKWFCCAFFERFKSFEAFL